MKADLEHANKKISHDQDNIKKIHNKCQKYKSKYISKKDELKRTKANYEDALAEKHDEVSLIKS